MDLHDVHGTILEDLNITGFNGGSGISINNKTAWTDRTSMLHVALGKDNGGNLIGIRMWQNGSSSTSFRYSRFLDLRMNLEAGQTGIQIENGALFDYSTVVATFNYDSDIDTTAVNVKSGGYAQENDIKIFGEAASANTIGVKVAGGATFGGQSYILLENFGSGGGLLPNTISSGATYQVGANSTYNSSGQFQESAYTVRT